MSKEQWDSRYSAEEYIYGIEPNTYLKEKLALFHPGRVLFPAEGEGRNAVYAATRGWEVVAFDQSDAGRAKAFHLAERNEVAIRYDILSFDDWQVQEAEFDCICLIFVHLPAPLRMKVHKNVMASLKPGGILIFEAFTKDQMPRTSGGPKNLELLFEPEDVKKDFASFEFIHYEVTQVELDEGPLHRGIADVVHFTARKSV